MDVDTLLLKLEEKEAELVEFQDSSRELEQELQQQLDECEKRKQGLAALNQRLLQDMENLKSRFAIERQELVQRVDQLVQQLQSEKSRSQALADGVRKLEQLNDDLERSKRVLTATLEDFESKFNSQIEKNVLLESELGEEELDSVMQRLKGYSLMPAPAPVPVPLPKPSGDKQRDKGEGGRQHGFAGRQVGCRVTDWDGVRRGRAARGRNVRSSATEAASLNLTV